MTRRAHPLAFALGLVFLCGLAAVALCTAAGIAFAAGTVTVVRTKDGAEAVSPQAFEQQVDGQDYLAVALGDVRVDGAVPQGVAVLGGSLELTDAAVVSGPVLVIGGELKRAARSRVGKSVVVLPEEWVAEAVRAYYQGSPAPDAPEGSLCQNRGMLRIHADSVTTGDVVVVGAALTIEGRVEGSVIALGSTVDLRPGSEVSGSIVTTDRGRFLKQDPAAVVRGGIHKLDQPRVAATAPPLSESEAAAAGVIVEAPEGAEPAVEADEGEPAPEEEPAPVEVDLDALKVVRTGPLTGDSFRVAKGERWDDLSVFGGTVTLDEGSGSIGDASIVGGDARIAGYLQGDVSVFGGNITVVRNGVIDGDITVFGGNIVLEDGARVTGGVTTAGGQVTRKPGAVVEGEVTTSTKRTEIHKSPELLGPVGELVRRVVGGVVRALLALGLVILTAALWPGRVRTVGDAVRYQAARCAGAGALTILALVLATVFITLVTCFIGAILVIPVGLILWLAGILGSAGISLLIGEFLAGRTRARSLPIVGSVVLGGCALTLVQALASVAHPFASIASVIGVVVLVLGVGAVSCTNWGTNAACTANPLGELFRRNRWHSGFVVADLSAPVPPAPPAAPAGEAEPAEAAVAEEEPRGEDRDP